MAQPSDTITRVFEVINVNGTSSGTTGLTGASFTSSAYRNGASIVMTPTVAELGAGLVGTRYSVAYTLPSTPGLIDFFIAPTSTSLYLVWPDLNGEVEADDFTSVKAAVVRTVATLGASGAPTNSLTLSVIKNCYHNIHFTIKDSTGAAVDLSGFNNWTFGVKNKAQTTVTGVPYALTAVTADANGLVTITVPETATVYDYLAAGEDATTDLYWSLQGDEAATASKSRVMARGAFIIQRKEN